MIRIHFAICYWEGDWRSVPRLYREIRSLFPNASIALIPDGLTPLPTTIEPIRLKPIDGGAWLRRIFETCPDDCDLFCKVEPDITIRRVPTFPNAEWFGHLSQPHGAVRPLLRGGFWGLKRRAVQSLLKSQVLYDSGYLREFNKYDRYGRFLLPGEKPAPMIYHCDTIMASAMNHLDIPPTPWDEIYLKFREPLPEDVDRYAVSTIGEGEI